MIVVAAIFLVLPLLVTLHLYTSGGFTNRRAFQYVFFTLLVVFALTIVIVIHHSYGFATTAPVSLNDVSPISSVELSKSIGEECAVDIPCITDRL